MQVVRRLFLLVGTAALVACKAGSGGVDVALGPNVGCSPLGLLGPAAILHGLVAGPGTEDPRMTTAALPVVSVSLLPNAQGSSLMQAIGRVCAWCRTPTYPASFGNPLSFNLCASCIAGDLGVAAVDISRRQQDHVLVAEGNTV